MSGRRIGARYPSSRLAGGGAGSAARPPIEQPGNQRQQQADQHGRLQGPAEAQQGQDDEAGQQGAEDAADGVPSVDGAGGIGRLIRPRRADADGQRIGGADEQGGGDDDEKGV